MNKNPALLLYARVLCAVAKTGGISPAAQLLEVTPSAVSNIISRLRTSYQDPIFVRAGARMVPTPRATELIARLGNVVESLEQAFEASTPFAPASSERAFHVASPDYLDPSFLPRLCSLFRQQAPLASLTVHPVSKSLNHTEQLELGILDLMICNWEDTAGNVHRQRLMDDPVVCMARANHPAFKQVLTIQAYGELAHIAPSLMGPGRETMLDAWLLAAGVKRRIPCSVPYFGLIPEILKTSDLVLTTGQRYCEGIMAAHPGGAWKIVPCPVPLPAMRFYQLWHARQNSDAGHAWLRTLVQTAVAVNDQK